MRLKRARLRWKKEISPGPLMYGSTFMGRTIKVGPYISGPDRFFHTFSQGLAMLGETATVQELRINCKKFAENNPPTWFTESLASNNYFKSSRTQNDIDFYIKGITDDREGQAYLEGRILCQLYDTKLYMAHPYLGIYYITIAVDESGVNKNKEVSYTRNIYIADVDNKNYQTVSIDKSKSDTNKTLTSTDDSTTCHSMVNDIQGLSTNLERREVIINGLKELRFAIIEGNIASVKYIDKILHDKLDETLLAELHAEVPCSTKNDFIILATMHERVDILYYLLHHTNILYYLTREQTDSTLEYEERCEAFHYAMCSDNIKILEILYDHWCTSMHWARRNRDPDDYVIRDLRKLSQQLNVARDRCGDQLVRNQQMLVDVHCLIRFTTYQIDVYTELRDLRLKFDYSDNSKEGEAERARILIVNILRIHKKHADNNDIRLEKSMADEERSVQELLKDDSSMYIRALLHVMYELYYRKLDFNVSLLLLDHLHILKQRLKTPESTYQKIECALYYYIYRVSEDWRLYLSINRPILTTNIIGLHNGILNDEMKTIFDSQKLLNGSVIYFERRHFQKSLTEFHEVLKDITISNNIRVEPELSHGEKHYLTLLPYMRDDYSLKRIELYIEAVLSIDMEQDIQVGMLIIERALQVVGEMFKNTDESFHLSTTTKALLQTAIGVETVKKFQMLRDKLSHVENGQLSVKIGMEDTKGDLFKKVKKDLKTIIYRIHLVLQIYKPILDKSLVSKGLNLLHNRLNELPDKAKFYRHFIKSLHLAYNLYNHDIYCMLEANFITEKWSDLGYTKQLLREIGSIQESLDQLSITENQIKKHMMCIILGTLPKYFDIIKNTLNDIQYNNDRWSTFKSNFPTFKGVLSAIPTNSEIQKVKDQLGSLKKKRKLVDVALLNDILLIKDYTSHWKSVEEVLRFILEEVQIFDENPFKIKHSRYSRHFSRHIKDSRPNDEAIKNVNEFMEMIKSEVDRLLKMYPADAGYTAVFIHPAIQQSFEPREFRGIDEMMNLFDMNESDGPQNVTDDKLKEQRAKLLECLIRRIDLLKKTLDHKKNIPLRQHLLRYECDQKFRIAIEMLLADIMNVFVECKNKSPLVKTSNLLTDINLRNVLDHGNPFLEVIGEALDSQDISTEFITWAMNVADDSTAIEALVALFKENVEFDTIENDVRDKMTTEQHKQLEVFKNCSRWRDYLKLIPKRRQVPLQKQIVAKPAVKSVNKNDWDKLMDAVKNKELEQVRVYIKGVRLDSVNDNGKSALHQAAMNGNVDIIKILIANGASVNLADGKNGKRPLHYAAMNGMVAAATALLQHGADATILDNDKNTAVSYVNKEKHEQLIIQLVQHLTVRMGMLLSVLS